jgi:hypothetical protein
MSIHPCTGFACFSVCLAYTFATVIHTGRYWSLLCQARMAFITQLLI